jgi:hypothetical protein
MHKKLISLIILFIFSIILFSATVQAGIKIWPGKINIEISEWTKKIEEKSTSIQVTNPYDRGINVTVKIEKPASSALESGFTPVPDTSWIEISPDSFYIPANSSKNYIVKIIVPEDQYSVHYNEKWDARAVFTSDVDANSGGMKFQIELAVKLLIKTPTGESEKFQYTPIVIIFIILGTCIVLYYIYLRKKNTKSKSIYYFKKVKKS